MDQLLKTEKDIFMIYCVYVRYIAVIGGKKTNIAVKRHTNTHKSNVNDFILQTFF